MLKHTCDDAARDATLRTSTASKITLEAEQGKNAAEKDVQELKHELDGKKAQAETSGEKREKRETAQARERNVGRKVGETERREKESENTYLCIS